MKRPGGIYAVCFLLAWSSVTDLWRSFLMIQSLAHGFPSGWFDRATIVLLVATPISGFPALVGLWLLRRWANLAFGVWAILAALQGGLIIFMVAAMAELKGFAWAVAVAMWIVAAGILIALWRYVRRVINSAPQQGAPA